MSRDQRGVEGLHVDDVPAGQVDEQGPGLHQRKLVAPDEVGVGFLAVNVHGDDVGLTQDGLHGRHLRCVTQGQAFGRVVEDDVEPHGLGEDGKLSADVAVADDAQRVTADLVRAIRALVPHAAVQARVLHGHPAGQIDDLADRQLDDGTRVGVGGVEYGDPHLGCGRKIDLVGTDAKRAYRCEAWTRA